MEVRKLVPKKKETEEKSPMTSEQFFSLIISAKMITHILHLQTDTIAKHLALDEAYKGLQKNADKLIEVYQGATEHMVDYDKDYLTYGYGKEPLEYLRALRQDIVNNCCDIIPDELTNVHNELDNFISTIDSAIYKIKFLA